jgi:hypothetical protein
MGDDFFCFSFASGTGYELQSFVYRTSTGYRIDKANTYVVE